MSEDLDSDRVGGKVYVDPGAGRICALEPNPVGAHSNIGALQVLDSEESRATNSSAVDSSTATTRIFASDP